jgi:hypothetical protein
LSFNYYANTEIFDERAEWTDDSFKKLDEDLVRQILEDRGEQSGSTIIQNAIQNNGGGYIGTQETREELPESTTGVINYKEFMNGFSASCQNYINTIISKLTDFKTPYNGTLIQVFGSKRIYSTGTASLPDSSAKVEIFGKPDEIQGEIDYWFEDIIANVSSEGLSWQIAIENRDGGVLSRRDQRRVYQNLTTYIENYKNNFTVDLSRVIQEILSPQEQLVINMEKSDFISSLHDGKINSDQSVEVLDISGITENNVNTFTKFGEDYQSITNLLNGFHSSLKDVGLIPSDSFDVNGLLGFESPVTPGDAKFMVIMDPIFRDDAKKQEFLTEVVKGTSNEESVKLLIVDYIFTRFYDVYKNKILNVDTMISNWKTTYEQQYTKIEGDTSLDRKFTYIVNTSASEDLQTQLRNIYLTGNSNDDKQTFNGKHKFN